MKSVHVSRHAVLLCGGSLLFKVFIATVCLSADRLFLCPSKEKQLQMIISCFKKTERFLKRPPCNICVLACKAYALAKTM